MTDPTVTDPALVEFVAEVVCDHFPDGVACAITYGDPAGFARAAQLLVALYQADRADIDDAVWRIGSELCDNDDLRASLANAELDPVAWLRHRITRTAT